MSEGKNVYYIISAVFFAFCAFAQSNDPDPILWIAGYLTAGCFLNVLVMLSFSRVQSLTKAVLGVNAVFLIWWIAALLPKLDYSLDLNTFAWSFLEFEEGREIGGLLLLLLHVMKLLKFQTAEPSSKTAAGSDGRLGTLAMLAVISVAMFLWVQYQPEMNMRENIEHCKGVFENNPFSSKGSSAEL